MGFPPSFRKSHKNCLLTLFEVSVTCFCAPWPTALPAVQDHTAYGGGGAHLLGVPWELLDGPTQLSACHLLMLKEPTETGSGHISCPKLVS